MRYGQVTIPVYQCGVYATITQLVTFAPDPHIPAVKSHLACTESGTNLLRIKNVLEAYGLRITAVRSISVRRLREQLRGGGTAVLALPKIDDSALGAGHFLSIVGNEGTAFISIDCPDGRRLIEWSQMAEALDSLGVTILLVDKPRDVGVDPPRVSVSPPVVDLGNLAEKKGRETVRFTITNEGQRPVLITGVRVPCGCMKAHLAGRYLAPSSSVKCEVIVDVDSWGAGHDPYSG